MVQQCLGSSGAILHYDKIAAKGIGVDQHDESNGIQNYVHRYAYFGASGDDDYITWEWEELIQYRLWLLEGTFVSAVAPNCGSEYPWSKIVNLEHSEIEIIVRDDKRYIWLDTKTYPNSPHSYSKHKLTSEAPKGGLIIKHPHCASETSHITSELVFEANLNFVSPAPNYNTRWKLRLYKDNIEFYTREYAGVMGSPPIEKITVHEEGALIPTTINFSKNPDFETLELISVPGKENYWQIIKYLLDENSNILAQEPFFSFTGKNSELYCVENGQCPENTCQVDCGNYCCCYNSKGYSVHAFNK